jgi:hypothetical protein
MLDGEEQEQPERKPTLENFLAGVPLNAEMEQLAREVMEEEAEVSAADLTADPFDPLRPLDDADRKALLKLSQDPGYEVLTRLRKITCAALEREATLVSQENPLGNAEKIAQGWAYLSIMRQLIQTEHGAIEAELAMLKPKRKKRQTQ